MERKIGERFDYKGKTLEVVEQNIYIGCNGCYFFNYITCYGLQVGKCCFISRSDCKSVIFKEVKK